MGLFDSITGGLFGQTAGGAADYLQGVAKKQGNLQGEAWGLSKDYLSQLRQAFSPYMTGNVGYDPTQLALMRSTFLNNAAKNYQNAGANVRANLARAGSAGNGPVGGDYARGFAGLEGAQADTVAGGLANIDLANLQQMLQNKFNAGQMLAGNAAQIGNWGNTFTQGMDSALGNYARVIPYTSGTAFGQAFGGVLGKGLGDAAMAGLGSLGGAGGGAGGAAPSFLKLPSSAFSVGNANMSSILNTPTSMPTKGF